MSTRKPPWSMPTPLTELMMLFVLHASYTVGAAPTSSVMVAVVVVVLALVTRTVEVRVEVERIVSMGIVVVVVV